MVNRLLPFALLLLPACGLMWPEGRVKPGEECDPVAEAMACSDNGRSVEICGESGVWFTRHACLPEATCGVVAMPCLLDAGVLCPDAGEPSPGPAGDGGIPTCLFPDGGSQGT